MVDPATLSIVVLLMLFVAAMWNRVNLGLLCFPAAFLVGAYAGITPDEITGFFPSDFVVLVLGVTSLFAVAQYNGTLPWLLDRALALVGGRLALIPWLTFAIGALLAGLGTLPAAAVAMVAPIALGFAVRYKFPPLLMVVVGFTGVLAGCFSPIAVYGLTALKLYEEDGIATPAGTSAYVFAATVGTGLLLTLVFTLAGRRIGRRPIGSAAPAGLAGGAPPLDAGIPTTHIGDGGERPNSSTTDSTRGIAPVASSPAGTATLTNSPAPATPGTALAGDSEGRPRDRILTLAALAVLLVTSVGFDVDLGYLAFTLAVALQLGLGLSPQKIVNGIPWNVIVLIAGILTYIGVLDATGGLARISNAISVGGDPVIGLLLLCYVVGVTSFFASSIAVLATAVPLLTPLVDAGLNPVGALIAVGLSALLVDVNPLGITGGLFLASTPEYDRTRLFRQLLMFGGASVVVAPALVWALFAWI